MKLKYYLRGLGIGVLVTAFIMGVAGKEKPMTDAEIKIRAAQLGMVEETVLSDLKTKEPVENEDNRTEGSKENPGKEGNAQDSAEEESGAKEEADGKEKSSIEESEDKSEQESIEEESIKKDTETDRDTGRNDAAENEASAQGTNRTVVQANGIVSTEENYVVITIESGNSCSTVSRKLYEAGMVESSEEYSNFLTSNGYAHRLRAGEHRIPAGASDEEIAKIICGIR